MRLLIVLLLSLISWGTSAVAQTGSAKTAAQMTSEINSLWVTSGQGQITAFTARQTLLDIVSSFGNTSNANTWTTIQTFNKGIATAAGGNIFENNGAVINRAADRLFIGDAVNYNPANCCAETGTWLAAANLGGLSGLVADVYISSHTGAGYAASGETPLFVAAQSAVSSSAGPVTYPITFLVANNNASFGTFAWGIYGEAYQVNSTVGGLAGMEIDIRNVGGIQYINDPYHWGGAGYTTVYEAGCGAGQASFTTHNCGGAFLVFANFNSFDSGIVFAGPSGMARDSIAPSGPNGERVAISMPEAYSICSYSAAVTVNVCEQGESNSWTLRGPTHQILFTVNTVASAVNYVSVQPNTTGNAPIITTLGSDSNINLQLTAQGSGVISLTSPLATTKAASINITANGCTENPGVRGPLYICNDLAGNNSAGQNAGLQIWIGNNPTATPGANNPVAATLYIDNLNSRSGIWTTNFVCTQQNVASGGSAGIVHCNETDVVQSIVATTPLSAFSAGSVVHAHEAECSQNTGGSPYPCQAAFWVAAASDYANQNATFTGSTSGSSTTLNVSGVSGTVAVGEYLSGTGVRNGTTITACSPNCASPTSLTMSGAAQTISSTTVTAGGAYQPWNFAFAASRTQQAGFDCEVISGDTGIYFKNGCLWDQSNSAQSILIAGTHNYAIDVSGATLSNGFANCGTVVCTFVGTGTITNATSTNTGASNIAQINNAGTVTNTSTKAYFQANLSACANCIVDFGLWGEAGGAPAAVLNWGSGVEGFAMLAAGSTILDYGITTASTWTFVGNFSISGLLILPNLSTDSAATTTRTVCQNVTGTGTANALYFGSGTAGICKGTSARFLKQDIAPLDYGLAEIMRTEVDVFRWRPGTGHDADLDKLQVGFMADNIAATMPRFATIDAQGHATSVDYMGAMVTLFRGVQQIVEVCDVPAAANDNFCVELKRRIAR